MKKKNPNMQLISQLLKTWQLPGQYFLRRPLKSTRMLSEGPSHHKVQFLWTERHISKATRVMLVTTRCSEDSYLNRVELQNGCLSRGHSNLFIPSTLHGSPYGSDGKIDESKYKNNMNAAV